MKKILLTIGIVGVLMCCVPTMSAGAVCLDNEPTTYSDDVQPRTAGLIYSYDLMVSDLNGSLCIDGSTMSREKMKTIGFTDIKIQRSLDDVNWSDYLSLDDILAQSAKSKYINSYTRSVPHGYYYRITCDHYAKESGMFGSSQSVSNTSNSVWID